MFTITYTGLADMPEEGANILAREYGFDCAEHLFTYAHDAAMATVASMWDDAYWAYWNAVHRGDDLEVLLREYNPTIDIEALAAERVIIEDRRWWEYVNDDTDYIEEVTS